MAFRTHSFSISSTRTGTGSSEPIKWDLKDPQRQTLWGAAAPESWFKHGTSFVGVAPKPSAMTASPIIAP